MSDYMLILTVAGLLVGYGLGTLLGWAAIAVVDAVRLRRARKRFEEAIGGKQCPGAGAHFFLRQDGSITQLERPKGWKERAHV